MKRFVKDFKKFLLRGNILDLAVAVVIGGAFSQIVNGFVTYIINPFIAVLTTGTDLTHLNAKIGTVSIEYGKFIALLINFVVIALVIFIIIEIISKAKSKVSNQEPNEVVVALETTDDILKDIRELLQNK